ncbi:MAG: hypothetical protein VX255_06450 [Candidatus Latescibacterota bacterium]|nr:hypothetical protein [Candidatus Latescibacterota bacterium]
MNVSNNSPSLALARAASAAQARSIEVTVSDTGVDVRSVAATAESAPTSPAISTPISAVAKQAAAPNQVASTQILQETLSTQETDAISERFADLPRSPSAGLYGRAGRQAAPPLTAQQGTLIDITG